MKIIEHAAHELKSVLSTRIGVQRGGQLIRRLIEIFAITAALLSSCNGAVAEQMVFRLASDGGSAGNEWIVADGEITPTSPDDFLAFLKLHGVKIGARYEVYLNSPGGNLFAGIKLGETIRQYGFGTRVASSIVLFKGREFETDGPGNCYSACSFTFLGGKWRIASDQTIGVHQYYTEAALANPRAKSFNSLDLSAQQTIAGLLADYTVRMGVDARFFTHASIVGPTEVYKFSSDEMTKFAITWNDLDYSDWSLEVYKDGLIAVSRTKNAENVATLFCKRDRALRLLLTIPNRFGSATEDASTVESITRRNPSVDLFGTSIPEGNISARIEKGSIKIEFLLPDGLDPDAPKMAGGVSGTKMKGMSALGSNRFWFYHSLSDKGFRQISKLVQRNCI